jgi:hypothetical protein
MFPDLTELQLSGCGLTDSELVQVFRTCQKLARLVDKSTDTIATVGRNPDGQLIKRVRDLCTILEV